jgi:hypothetical protein
MGPKISRDALEQSKTNYENSRCITCTFQELYLKNTIPHTFHF